MSAAASLPLLDDEESLDPSPELCSSEEISTATARGRWRLGRFLGSCEDFPEARAVDAAVNAEDDDAENSVTEGAAVAN